MRTRVVHISTLDIDPSEVFNFGVWEKIEGAFLYGADDDSITNGSNGGRSEIILSVSQLPRHTHTFYANDGSVPEGSQFPVENQTIIQGAGVFSTIREELSNVVGETGGNLPIEIMPPYLAVNIWKRVE